MCLNLTIRPIRNVLLVGLSYPQMAIVNRREVAMRDHSPLQICQPGEEIDLSFENPLLYLKV